jgi:hypothetical protein
VISWMVGVVAILCFLAGQTSVALGKGAKVALGGRRVVKAGGDSRAWSALKQVLPGDVELMGQVNLSALRAGHWLDEVRGLLEKDRGLADRLARLKTECHIDLGDTINDVAFAGLDTRSEKTIIAVSLRGVAEPELRSCGERLLARERGKAGVISMTRSGAISEYVLPDEPEHLFVAWLAPDVVAFVSDGRDRTMLEKLVGGQGAFARAPLPMRALATVNTGAAAWGAYLESDDAGGKKMRFGVGSLSTVSGGLALDVALVFTDAQGASEAATSVASELAQLSGSGLPPMLTKILKAVVVGANGDTVKLVVSVTQADLLALANSL